MTSTTLPHVGATSLEENGHPAAGLALSKPWDGEKATHGNGTMVALAAKDPAQVDRLYRIAMDNGARDEGAPGPRGDDGFYAAYFRDPDGNKLNAFCYAPPA